MSDPDLMRRNFSFQMQIGLTREQVNVEGELSLASLKEIACAFVDRKVGFELLIPLVINGRNISVRSKL